MSMTVTRDLHIGRLGLPSIEDPITEQLGSDISTVGDATAVGQRRAKGFTLNFIVHGFDDTSPTQVGNRMRRALRSMIQNEPYRLAGIYMQFAPDTERNGWLVIGEAQLADDDGGVTFGSYKLTMSQAYLVGNQDTHRDAYRVDLTDLRQTSSPLDYLGEKINLAGNFANMPALPLAFAPVGATDITVLDSPIAPGERITPSGTVAVLAGRINGDVVSWEREDAAFNSNDDVVIYDRRGNTTALPTP